jgi:hypothetical protein
LIVAFPIATEMIIRRFSGSYSFVDTVFLWLCDNNKRRYRVYFRWLGHRKHQDHQLISKFEFCVSVFLGFAVAFTFTYAIIFDFIVIYHLIFSLYFPVDLLTKLDVVPGVIFVLCPLFLGI